MSDNLVAQGYAYSVQELADSFHEKLPNDQRFVNLTRLAKPPLATVTENGCEFRFPAIPDIYLIGDITIELGIRLVTKGDDAATPGKGALVGPVNNG
jgi:hypothetical protein